MIKIKRIKIIVFKSLDNDFNLKLEKKNKNNNKVKYVDFFDHLAKQI